MANRKLQVSGTGKEMLDSLTEVLEIERPYAIKIAVAKGIAADRRTLVEDFNDNKPKWTMGDSIIKDEEYLLFKHLIINEQERFLGEEEVSNYLLFYLENGLRIINQETAELSSLEDYRIKVLG